MGEKPFRKNTHHNSCERRWLQANERKINVNWRTIQLDPFESIQFDLICICIQTVVFLSFQFLYYFLSILFIYSHDDRYNRCTYAVVYVCVSVYAYIRYNNVYANQIAEIHINGKPKNMKCNYVKPLNQRPNGKIHFLCFFLSPSLLQAHLIAFRIIVYLPSFECVIEWWTHANRQLIVITTFVVSLICCYNFASFTHT